MRRGRLVEPVVDQDHQPGAVGVVRDPQHQILIAVAVYVDVEDLLFSRR